MKGFLEMGKSLLILGLILLATYLTASMVFFGEDVFQLAGDVPSPMSELPLSAPPALVAASQPTAISIATEAGRVSTMGDFTALDETYQRLGSFLAEALDTAETPRPITTEEFLEALDEPGVYFSYPCAIGLSTLAQWLDGQCHHTLSAQEFLLSVSYDKVELFVRGKNLYAMDTQIDPAVLVTALGENPADGSFFAKDVASLAHLDPLTLLPQSPIVYSQVTSVNPCNLDFLQRTATALGFNPYGDTQYVDGEGATIFTESDCSLRLSLDGLLSLKCFDQSDRFLAQNATEASQIDYVSSLLTELLEGTLGDGRLMLTQYTTQDNRTLLTFDYFVAGLPVTMGETHTVNALFQGNALSFLDVAVRTYTAVPDSSVAYLPQLQAAALAPEGTKLSLAYGDLAGETLSLGWLQNSYGQS